MTEDQLSSLLRTIKRHEVPPPGYFDGLLRDIHQRQRTELLRRPLWRIAMDRMQTFFGEHSMSPLTYAGAMASVLVAGIAAIGLVTPSAPQPGHTDLAIVSPAVPSSPVAVDRILTLQTDRHSRTASSSNFPRTAIAPQGSAPVLQQPRYVIDARPVSYEGASSISF